MTSGTWKFRPRPAPYNIAPYPWDKELSVGTGPPTAVVVRGYDPFTPDSQLRSFFSSYGDVAEVDNKTDPTTGVFLGVCSIKYRDSRGRGPVVLGVAAARRAEKEASGHRIGLQTIKVERDPGGKKCRRLAESISKHNREQREKEQRQEATRKPVVAAPPPPSVSTEAPAAPPPNAPKGPSGKPAEPVKQVPKMSHLIEQEPILSKIKRKPYIFIGQEHVPVMGTTVPHLKKRLKTHHWEDIRCDETGYYVIFEDHKRGEDEALRCFREYNKRELFTYRMIMECQQYGNPKYERSPSPERKVELKRQHEEEERLKREEEMDIEEEKKSRAANMDPVTAAIEQLRIELRDKIMADIKTRIGAPALHDFLDPTKHVDKRRKLGIADPSRESKPASFLTLGGADAQQRISTDRSKPLYGASITRIQREAGKPSSNNVFLDERRQNVQRKPKRKVNVRSLHQQLHDFYDDDESDDERRTVLTKDSGDRSSRPASRMSSLPPSERDEQVPFTPRKKRRTDRSQTPRDEESGDEDDAIAESALPPALLKKEAEELMDNELALITRKLPPDHRLHKRAKVEIAARAKAQEDDRLFRDKADATTALGEPGIATIDDIVQSTEILSHAKTKKKLVKTTKKKSKKQIFEEREAAKEAAAKAKIAHPEDATPEVPSVEEIEKEVEEEEAEIDEERAEISWGLSTDRPRRTVEDDYNEVLDIDAWQRLVKDNEDIELLLEVLSDHLPASFGNANRWAHQQKAIKALNKGKTMVDGYYVPNQTGSARTEGVKMILQSEKSKYLPHRIKVAKAREEREKEADNPKSHHLVASEAARQAKAASTATSRSNRANNRTQVKDITTAKQNLIAEGGQADTIKFNQLKKRKKLVTFNRSAIHGWGLYAEENIAANDMIIEYVGEKIRPAVANIRELRYDKQGIGSSYLFRINDDFTVDATKKGGIARFINHSCAPNCTAKIVKVDDEDRIAIYAKCEVRAGEELTYGECTNLTLSDTPADIVHRLQIRARRDRIRHARTLSLRFCRMQRLPELIKQLLP